jgi:cellulose synthase/poly-beta-1,6-N-acetylglucosamine synthase-like glycosyltransferase
MLGGAGFLAYTYAGYPLLVRVLPHRRRDSRREAPPEQPCSVVIASRGGGRRVVEKVRELLDAAYGVLEVVVALDGPDDEARRGLAALHDSRVRVVASEDVIGKAEALNRAVGVAGGGILAFTDVRQRFSAAALDRLRARVSEPGIGAVSGALRLGHETSGRPLARYWEWEKRLRCAESRRDSTVGVTGALYVLRASLWTPLRPGLLLDDVCVPMNVVRHGYRVQFEPEAAVVDEPLRTEAAEFHRKVRTLTGNYQLLAWLPWLLSPWHNPLWWEFVSHKVCRLLTPLATTAMVSGAALLIVAAVGWLAAAGAVLAAAAGVSILACADRWRARVLRGLREIWWVHAALVVAFLNGARGRWDVWREAHRQEAEDAA